MVKILVDSDKVYLPAIGWICSCGTMVADMYELRTLHLRLSCPYRIPIQFRSSSWKVHNKRGW